MENEVYMDIGEEDSVVDFFLWISHGDNISSESNFYPIETKFQSIILYSKPFQAITSSELKDLLEEPCKLLVGSCPRIPIENEQGRHVFLPPLVFRVSPDIQNSIGLYYITFNKYDNVIEGEGIKYFSGIKCKSEIETLYNQENLVNKYGGDNFITYSQIFKLVKDECSKKNLNPKDVLLGIFSCQTNIEEYSKKYAKKITDLIPRQIDTIYPTPATIFTGNQYPANSFVSLTIIPFIKLPSSWNALAKITHQGCGINILSYFGIIEENYAREIGVCLSIKGTSIFKIVDYINYYLKKIGVNQLGYFVARSLFNEALDVLLNFVLNYKENDKYAIIFKMYNDDILPTGKKSHIGHTVAIFKYGQNIYYTDPQKSLVKEIDMNFFKDDNQIKSLYGFTNGNYNLNWKYIDIIFTVSQEPFQPSRISLPITQFIEKNLNVILVRTPDINYGGRNLFKKVKSRKYNLLTRKRVNKIKNIKNSKSKKNKKTMKNRKKHDYKGGDNNLDAFEQLMIDIDKKNNIPTVLSKLEIKDLQYNIYHI
jgi:hypothetical protein